MKKYLSTLAVVALAASAFAQGTVAFKNDNTSLLKANGTSIPANGGFAQLIWAPSGTADPSAYQQGDPAAWFQANPAWLAIPASITAVAPTPGRFNGGTVTVPTATPGAGIKAIVAGWDGNFADLNAAWTGKANIGFSAPFALSGTGNPNSIPPGTAVGITGAGLFTGVNALPTGVPEPSTLALAGLGVAALLVLRRRS
jgi:hypothetical protein